MIAVLSLSAALALCAPPAPARPAPPAPAADPSLQALFQGGRTFEAFLGGVGRRTELWKRLDAEGAVDGALVERARALGGTWRILAVAEDWCGDSAYNLPYVAKLVSALQGSELRIVDSRAGRTLMETHRTPDGRAATPTFLLLDAGWEEVGCFVERPPELVAWTMENRASKSSDELHEHIVAWYESNGGRGTVEEIVEMMESAAAGRPRCPGEAA